MVGFVGIMESIILDSVFMEIRVLLGFKEDEMIFFKV